ncbi:hypothetical protein [Kribbella sp. VKM Ac-2566]|uniref:hypothetical protein n=1 Tax=Kribbella sp. VKM Ac-2566 TaxID=2512218 RepID=UPI001416ED9B|nr:hypothetical protein [Kribbella sp. VKM Ac-2566]
MAEKDHDANRCDEIADVLRRRTDEGWNSDRELIDQNLADPWEPSNNGAGL